MRIRTGLLNLEWESTLRFIKFLGVGVINTLFGYGIFALFLFIGLHFSLACLFGTILGVFFNFFTTGRIVFNNKNNLLIWKFILVYAILYLFNVFFLSIINYFNGNLYIWGFVLLGPMAVIAFLLNQLFVFNEGVQR